MKIYIDSYNNVMQQGGGGVPMRIRKFMHYYTEMGLKANLFNKWEDKLTDCDILHIFKVNIDSFAQITFAKQLGKKVVVSSVIPQENVFRIHLSLIINKLFPINNTYSYQHRILQMADAIVAQTAKEKAFISRHYKIHSEKIHVIPNGVNEHILEAYDPAVPKDILLCVGRFDSNKNQLALVNALKGTNYECHFVGGAAIEEPNYFERCKDEASSNSKIYFHGWMKPTDEEYLDLYRRAKVVALISHKEIFGNSLIEGGACGANLLATKELPIEEWGFGNHCVKVNSSDVSSIREGLDKAIEMPISSAIHNRVEQLFSWKNIANRHYELYKALLT